MNAAQTVARNGKVVAQFGHWHYEALPQDAIVALAKLFVSIHHLVDLYESMGNAKHGDKEWEDAVIAIDELACNLQSYICGTPQYHPQKGDIVITYRDIALNARRAYKGLLALDNAATAQTVMGHMNSAHNALANAYL